ncbi:CocE/NonD family hydrolase [Nocardiopsis potens]|uniref:CocE/NonD family hydrolase n=1 Tax=Nocardiopsis potens TaxID=1246458 RepID=UPI0003484392|nr:CocE/NonD family hydrolase [Nocardiopsis potens]
MTPDPGRDHRGTAPDGTVLRGRWWESAHPRAVVLIRTPYGAHLHASTARSWNERGYHCLVQDVRGRYRSQGSWAPYAREQQDGGALLEQVAAEHPGLPVVLFGASYAAHTALEAARAAAPGAVAAVIALVPALGLAETAWNADGEPQIRHRIGWWHQHGRTGRPAPPLPPAELDRRTAHARERGVLEAAEDWDWPPEARAGWRRLWTSRRTDLRTRYRGATAPLLVVSGDHDFFHADARRLAREWSAASHFAGGPWGHRLAGGVTDPDRRARIAAAGGLSRVIDPWLAANGLPGTPAEWTRLLAPGPGTRTRTRSLLGPESAAWRHERTPS